MNKWKQHQAKVDEYERKFDEYNSKLTVGEKLTEKELADLLNEEEKWYQRSIDLLHEEHELYKKQ